MAMPANRVSARDVAERAGVSVTTVSRVMNDKGGELTPETRERVRAAARELGYRAHPAAVALRGGRTGVLGLVVPDLGDQYFQQIARGVEDASHPQGYGIVFCNTDRDIERENEAIDLLLAKRVDGIVFCGGGLGDDAHLAGRDWFGTSVVTIGPHLSDFPAVTVDDTGAIRAMVAHLADMGRRRILCVAGKEDWLVVRTRLAAYRAAVAELGLDQDPALVDFAGFTADDGRAAVERALDGGVGFDAVLAFNDYGALGAIDALLRRGLSVPGDVAVSGCDDIDFAVFARVPLTSLRFQSYAMGRAAVRLFAGDRSEEPRFGYELRVRASTAPLTKPAQPTEAR
ncbi:LacI family DNA-binding transcriptional regulator [Streptomyces sp. 8L]|uniref:LacI family DNA-binding transcriptional regulator n=1 Tax=unclassified Streptomyces TaxID=2593676 RepID=UPI001CD42345|nr:LacI family DNA-binding transcriptional regulator [Streptomyces sp. 8L]MCA1218088.1 LacI family transcriptional regulator [Streptomyces sp. 8L]